MSTESHEPQRQANRQHQRLLHRLRWTLLVVGAGWTAFFLAAVPVALFDLIDHSSTAGQLLLWGHGGRDYLLMISAINIVIGVALLIAARDPAAHGQVIGMCLAINAVHMATMLTLGLNGDGKHLHLVGDIAFGILPTLALALAWKPTRRGLSTREDAVRRHLTQPPP